MNRYLGYVALLLALWAFPTAAASTQNATRTLYLVRHGHYEANPQAHPQLGPGLSALGVAQAELVAARLHSLPFDFDALWVSPLQRARDTAAAMVDELAVHSRFEVEPDLAECTPPTRRLEVIAEEDAQALSDCKAQLERLLKRHFRPAQGAERNELMVCHGNVIRYLVTRALGVDSQAWLEMSVGHASITRIRIEADGSYKVTAVGDVGHIPANLQTGASGDAERSLQIQALP